ncbi:MAG: hypothetical protein IJH88_05360 [Eggerthellaceae bacterium]|nr:hypothetical protein [Eggerthellaceae bacterium]
MGRMLDHPRMHLCFTALIGFVLLIYLPSAAYANTLGSNCETSSQTRTIAHQSLYAQSGGDEEAPVITSVNILNKDAIVQHPGYVTVEVSIEENETGVRYLIFGIRSLNGEKLGGVDWTDGPLYSGTYTFDVPLPENACNGEWCIDLIQIEDQAGNAAFYQARGTIDGDAGLTYDAFYTLQEGVSSQLTSIPIALFTVEGFTGDLTPPRITDIKIMNQDGRVEKPGNLQVQLCILEIGDGVTSVDIYASSSNRQSSVHYYRPDESRLLQTGTYVFDVPVDCQT